MDGQLTRAVALVDLHAHLGAMEGTADQLDRLVAELGARVDRLEAAGGFRH